MARKAASGTGTIRKKTVTRNGKAYSYWEARYTEGVDPGTGKQIQRSISGKTQKEVAQKLKAATASMDAGTYTAPSKLTVGEWADIWARDYLGGVKPRTAELYRGTIKTRIKPALGAVKLEVLNAHTIQGFYNALSAPNGDKPGLSPKTVKNINGILHKALQQAVAVGYLRFNPADVCTLPRMERREIHPLDDAQVTAFLVAIKGHPMEDLFTLALFTGLREGEVLGLTWECIDFKAGRLTVGQQLQRSTTTKGAFTLPSPKNGKKRTIAPANAVMAVLKRHRGQQSLWRIQAGEAWACDGGIEGNTANLVFTDEIGRHLSPRAVYRAFKAVAASIGIPAARVHDLRHTYAVAAIRSGDDLKTVQGNLGHATASFTLDVYGHFTEQMKAASAARMDAFIKGVSGQ